MASAVKNRIILSLLTVVIVPTLSVIVILFAKGYRPSNSSVLTPTGIILAQSDPDGAQIFVNGKLSGATNQNLTLEPSFYEVEIKKDGFVPWKKTLQVTAETVTRASANLFPSVTSLKAITANGANIPIQSPDGSKVAFVQQEKNQSKIFTLDLNESPLGLINRDPKLQTTLSTAISRINWSPDSRQLLLTSSSSAILLDMSNSQVRDITTGISSLTATWSQLQAEKDTSRMSTLPKPLQEILTSSAANITWSPRENKILYTATNSAVIPEKIFPPLPGSNSQPQERTLTPGTVYIFDLEEDRNFKIDTTTPNTPTPKQKAQQAVLSNPTPNAGWFWFPDSNHVYKVDGNKIVIKEYDNQNQTTVYSEPKFYGFAAPYPSGKQILILTNLNPELSTTLNLYAVSLK